MTFERLRGFRDLYPQDAEPKFYILQAAQEVARSFGFQHIDIPSLEPLDLYRLKSGDELVSQTFSFVDKGGREVTLIPEATPSVVRMLTSRKDLSKPVRWYSLPKIWRYEEPQSGRSREHIQFNADIFGPNTPEADAEIMGLAATILDSVGLEEKYSLRVNDRKLMESILTVLGAEKPLDIFPIIDKFRKISEEEFKEQLLRAGLSEESAEKLTSMMGKKANASSLRSVIEGIINVDEELSAIIGRVETTLNFLGTYTRSEAFVDFSIVRGLSYYTGIVFEAFDTGAEFRSILGGGRYDNLSKLMSEQDIPAVGFGMGDVVIELLMKKLGIWKVPAVARSFYICVASPDLRKQSLSISSDLRKAGYTAISDISQRSLSAQLRNASVANTGYAIILGKKETEEGSVTLRDLSRGTQTVVRKDVLLETVSKL